MTGCGSVRTELYLEETRYLYEKSCLAYKQGDFSTAEKDYRRIIELDPNYAEAYAGLANLSLVSGQFKQAEAYYIQAITHDPGLKAALESQLFNASMYSSLQPLVESGVTLRDIYPLLMAENIPEVEQLIAQNIPLELLAKDSFSVTPGTLAELRTKAAELAPHTKGSTRYRMLLAYLLFFGGEDQGKLVDLLQRTVPDTTGSERGDAYLLLGRTYLREDKITSAVDSFIAAIDAGSPNADVAPFLARIYQVDPETLSAIAPKIEIATPPPPPLFEATAIVDNVTFNEINFPTIAQPAGSPDRL